MSAPTATLDRFRNVFAETHVADEIHVDVETRPDFEVVLATMQARIRDNVTRLAASMASLAPAIEEATANLASVRARLEREGVYRWNPEAAVANGIAFLDERYGRDVWLSRVNLSTLDVADGWNCVAAQVEGRDYYEAVERMMGSNHRADQFYPFANERGFSVPDVRGTIDGYERLTKLWKDAIYRLRAEARGSDESVRITS